MKNIKMRLLPLLLALALLCACAAPQAKTPFEQAAVYALQAYEQPEVCAADWSVMALARGGADVPEGYFDGYYASVEAYVADKGGVLHERKYTEYSRLVLALTAIGEDPRDVAGYDLLRPLGDFDTVNLQGINGTIFALLALDSGGYDVPQDPDAAVQATREGYLQYILDAQGADGGWSLAGGSADADLTAMALCALAPYRGYADTAPAVERGLSCLSGLQDADGGFTAYGASNCETVCQVILALTSLSVAPDDARFVKNGASLPDVLARFAQKGGGYAHTLDGGTDSMASEQALCALAALRRADNGQSGFYQMTN